MNALKPALPRVFFNAVLQGSRLHKLFGAGKNIRLGIIHLKAAAQCKGIFGKGDNPRGIIAFRRADYNFSAVLCVYIGIVQPLQGCRYANSAFRQIYIPPFQRAQLAYTNTRSKHKQRAEFAKIGIIH